MTTVMMSPEAQEDPHELEEIRVLLVLRHVYLQETLLLSPSYFENVYIASRAYERLTKQQQQERYGEANE